MTKRLLELEPTDLFGEQAIVMSLAGREEMSRPFEFFASIASPKDNIRPEQVIGQPIAIRIDRADEKPRYVHGYISHLWAGDFSESLDKASKPSRSYRIRIVPWLWFLTQASRCFVYLPEKEKKSIQDVFDEVLKRVKSYGHIQTWHEAGNASILKSRMVEHCVQYRETDFNFLSRTLENYGVFYFFKHEKDKHTMVLSDRSNYPDCDESSVEYATSTGEQMKIDRVTSWEHSYEFVPGKWMQTDYNFEKPSTDMKVKAAKHGEVSLTNNSGYEMYDYPGVFAEKDEGSKEVERRIEEEEIRFDTISGGSRCKSFTAGHCFKLTKHHSCAGEAGKSFLITSLTINATQPGPFTGQGVAANYENHFSCMPNTRQFRPPRVTPHPTVASIQTAVVVGPQGEEIYTDKYGRVKVQFYWDREGKRDENTSCWLRVSQAHSGVKFGYIDIPRVGEEVIVSFIEGNLDRPMVTGRVYHEESMQPFDLPKEKTRSGMKTKTYKGTGYNELSMDDQPDKQQIRIHAERDMDSTVKRNRRTNINVNDTLTIGGNQTRTINGNRTTKIKKDDTLTITDGNRSETLDKGNDSLKIAMGNRSATLDKGNDSVKATLGNISFEAPAGKYSVNAKDVEIVGTASIKLTVGPNSITIDPSGIKINGVMIESAASAVNTLKGMPVKINC